MANRFAQFRRPGSDFRVSGVTFSAAIRWIAAWLKVRCNDKCNNTNAGASRDAIAVSLAEADEIVRRRRKEMGKPLHDRPKAADLVRENLALIETMREAGYEPPRVYRRVKLSEGDLNDREEIYAGVQCRVSRSRGTFGAREPFRLSE